MSASSFTIGPVRPELTASLADPELRNDLARSVGRRVGDADVEDVVQSVLTEAFTSRRLPETPEEIRRFVFAIARQRIVDCYRRRDRERPAEADLTAPDELEDGAAKDLLEWARATLPAAPAATQTFDWMLREGAGESLAEIAAAERIPAAAVRQRVSRLRRFFRERWTKEVAALGAVGLLALVLGASVLWRDRENVHPVAVVPQAAADPSVVPASTPSAEIAAPPLPGIAIAPVSPATPPFDPAAAAASLAKVDLKGCATPTTPAGVSHVTVVFEPSGNASSATVDGGAIQGRPEAKCAADRFLAAAHVPPFVGAPVKVGKSFAVVATGRDSGDESKTKASCDPPYTVDDLGRKHYRVDCLR